MGEKGRETVRGVHRVKGGGGGGRACERPGNRERERGHFVTEGTESKSASRREIDREREREREREG